MSNSSPDSRDDVDGRQDGVSEKPLETLRRLIAGPTDHRIDGVTRQLTDPDQRTRAVSDVLPAAVTLGAAKDNKLASALEPIMENAIRASIKKDRRVLVDALFPVMGPAIRKAIASTIQGLIQNFNQILEYSVSFRGLRWRFEALRTRRSFAEVVLLNTLIYQVEQVFLIHRESGLMLEHVVAKTAVVQNPDLVSGMLTAIKDFVQDSFGAAQEDTLDTFQVGERKIWIEHGTYAVMALVINGNPPVDLREMMRDAMDEIHLKQSESLASFNGDSDSFQAVRPILNGLLQVQFKKPQPKPAYRLWVFVGIIVALTGWGFFRHMSAERQWRLFADRLQRQPGIVVTQVRNLDGHRHIHGLKDPYAQDPSIFVKPSGLSPDSVVFHWEPYQSAYPEFARRRIAALFNPPATVDMAFEKGQLTASGSAQRRWIEDARRLARIVPWIDQYTDRQVVDIDHLLERPLSVTLTLEGKTLRASGSAPHAWIARARAAAGRLPGVGAYDDSHLVDTDVQAWESLCRAITETVFYFETGTNQLVQGQEKDLQSFVNSVRQLIALSQLLGRPMHIEVIGHADRTGDEMFNIAVSRERAIVFAELLFGAGIKDTFIAIHGAGSQEPARPEVDGADRAVNRRVVFKVIPADN